MKSALLRTILSTANVHKFSRRIICKAPSAYIKDKNWFKIDKEFIGIKVLCCDSYVDLENLIESCYTLNNGGCYR